jgi:hypothetical protein
MKKRPLRRAGMALYLRRRTPVPYGAAGPEHLLHQKLLRVCVCLPVPTGTRRVHHRQTKRKRIFSPGDPKQRILGRAIV